MNPNPVKGAHGPRPCRWYDEYPDLVFALKLLGLAPVSVREATLDLWRCWMKETYNLKVNSPAKTTLQPLEFPHPSTFPETSTAIVNPRQHSRWTDHSESLTQALETMRQCSDSVKIQSAQKIILYLMESSVA